MRRTRRILTALLALGAVACASPIKTTHDADPSADFSAYTSYAWLHQVPDQPGSWKGGGLYISPLDDRRIRAAVDDGLRQKGYVRASDPEAADMVVAYAVGAEERLQVRQTAGRDRVYTSRYGGYGTWYENSPASVSTYTEGTLALEFFDRKKQQAVWVGYAQKRLSRNNDSEAVIKRVVAAVLEDFPARTE